MKFKNGFLITAFLFAFSIITVPATAAPSGGVARCDSINGPDCVDYGLPISGLNKNQKMRADRKMAIKVLSANNKSFKRIAKRLKASSKEDLSGAEEVCSNDITKSIESMPEQERFEAAMGSLGLIFGYSVAVPINENSYFLNKEQTVLRKKAAILTVSSKTRKSRLFARSLKAQALSLQQEVQIFSALDREKLNSFWCDLKTTLLEQDGYSSGSKFNKVTEQFWLTRFSSPINPNLNNSKLKKQRALIKKAKKEMRKIKPKISRERIQKYNLDPARAILGEGGSFLS